MSAWSKALWPLALGLRDPLVLCLLAGLVFVTLRCGGRLRRYALAFPLCLALLAGQRYPEELAHLLLPLQSPLRPYPGYRGWLFLCRWLEPGTPYWAARLLMLCGAGLCALLCYPWLMDLRDYLGHLEWHPLKGRLLLVLSFLGLIATAATGVTSFAVAVASCPPASLAGGPTGLLQTVPESLLLALPLCFLCRNAGLGATGEPSSVRRGRRGVILASSLLLAAAFPAREPWTSRILPDFLLFLNLFPLLPPFTWEDISPERDGLLEGELVPEEEDGPRQFIANSLRLIRQFERNRGIPHRLWEAFRAFILVDLQDDWEDQEDILPDPADPEDTANPADPLPFLRTLPENGARGDPPEAPGLLEEEGEAAAAPEEGEPVQPAEFYLLPFTTPPPPPPGHQWARAETAPDPRNPHIRWL